MEQQQYQKLSNIPTRFRHRILDPPSHPQPNTPPDQPLEFSEHEIFSTTQSNSSSPSSTHQSPKHHTLPRNTNGGGGILAALLNDPTRSRSGSDISPVFNHKASTSTSSSISPSTSILMIPKRPATTNSRVMFPQSAPVNVPVIPFSVRRRAMELDEIVSEELEELELDEEEIVVVPPHELVDQRDSRLMLSCSVLEGAGRTLKGRDLRQVRNAIWRRTGFID